MIRFARRGEFVDVMRVLDAAALEVDPERVRERLDSAVLVASEDGRVRGALVLDGSEIEAVAVRRSRRDRGLGRALVDAASATVEGPVRAEFDEEVSEFYEALAFDVERLGNGRCRGVR